MSSYIDKINNYHPDVIASFLKTGDSSVIPKELQLFIAQIQFAVEIYKYEKNITRAAEQLHVRVAAEQKINLDVRTCKSRIYSAINYFSVDNNVTIKVWEENFADRYADLEKIAIAKGDYKTAKICVDAQAECRRRASEAAEVDRDWAPVFIISPELAPEDLGFKRKNLTEIARKYNEGFYLKFIDSLPIENEEKIRLKHDANVIDIESTVIESD